MWLRTRLNWANEDGIENIEWIALAAVILVMLVAVMAVLKPFGTDLGDLLSTQIKAWVSLWAP